MGNNGSWGGGFSPYSPGLFGGGGNVAPTPPPNITAPPTAASVFGQANHGEAQLPGYLQLDPNQGNAAGNMAMQRFYAESVNPALARGATGEAANGMANSTFAAGRDAAMRLGAARTGNEIFQDAKNADMDRLLRMRGSYFQGAGFVPKASQDNYNDLEASLYDKQRQFDYMAQQNGQQQQQARTMQYANAGIGAAQMLFGGGL